MKKLFLALTVFALVLLPMSAMAISGSLSTPTDVVATGNWSDTGPGFKISWDITETAGVWTYEYTISNKTGGELGRPGLSHIIIEVCDELTKNTIGDYIFNAVPAYQEDDPRTYTGADPGDPNPNMPNPIFGIKFEGFDEGEVSTVTFDSFLAPVLGSFYAKGGQNQNLAEAWNSGLQGGDAFIYVPGCPNPAPIPGSLLLLGTGVLGLVGLRKIF